MKQLRGHTEKCVHISKESWPRTHALFSVFKSHCFVQSHRWKSHKGKWLAHEHLNLRCWGRQRVLPSFTLSLRSRAKIQCRSQTARQPSPPSSSNLICLSPHNDMSDYLYGNPTQNGDRSTSREGKHTFANFNGKKLLGRKCGAVFVLRWK